MLLPLGGLAAILRAAPANALDAADVAKPVSLPDMVLGAADAPMTIVEYAVPTCPHCAAFDREIFPRIKAEYIDTGKARYVAARVPAEHQGCGRSDAAAPLHQRREHCG